MNINDYPINFPYGATSSPYSSSHPHRGNDLPLHEGDPVRIKGFQIGLAGHTGVAVGSHVHVQAGHDPNAQQTIDSKPYIGQPGTVFKTGTASEWGNYVCVKVGDVYVYYCHLSQITCNIGDIIKGEYMTNRGDVINFYKHLLGREPSEDEIKIYVNRPFKDVIYGFMESDEFKKRVTNKPINRGDVINYIAENLK